ncbi:MAG: hypothetical protein AAF945_21560, partial [Actinomycetota bacterium]
MDGYLLDRLRSRLDAGDGVSDNDVRRLIEDLGRARRAAGTPAEFVVRVARDLSDSDRWTAEHPLFRMTPTARHPADALVLAGTELRTRLEQLDWPDPDLQPDPFGRRRVDRVTRAEVEATMRAAGEREAASIGWALGEIDRLRTERDEALGRRAIDAAA